MTDLERVRVLVSRHHPKINDEPHDDAADRLLAFIASSPDAEETIANLLDDGITGAPFWSHITSLEVARGLLALLARQAVGGGES